MVKGDYRLPHLALELSIWLAMAMRLSFSAETTWVSVTALGFFSQFGSTS